MTLNFAYGANMDPTHMSARCPGAKRLGLAVLSGHEFRIAAAGYGNAVPAPGQDIHGVLWELTPEDERALDDFEGLAEGMYRKDSALVDAGDGSIVRAMLYLPVDPAPGRPRPGYLERIIEVAETLGFPGSYVARLSQLLSPQGPSAHPY